MVQTEIKEGIAVYHLKSWREFIDWIDQQHANCPALIYRGQANAQWKVKSTLDRLEYCFPKKPNHDGNIPEFFDCPPVGRDTHLKAFRESARGRRGLNPPTLDDNEWWALAQQHGLATPMLDWTLFPFVAFFFAFEERYCADEEGHICEPQNRAVFAVSSSCITEHDCENDPSPRPYVPTAETSYRIINQGGVFLRMPQRTDLESYVRAHFGKETSHSNLHPRAILQKIIVPNDGRIDCLKFLNKMNINRSSLFPDLDGAARYINALWELDFDTSLGYLPGTLS